MRFVPAHLLSPGERARAVSVDGAADAAVQLGHWPGAATPERFRADLGVEAALRFAASERGALEIATNDHHDADGVLSLLAVLRPDEARSDAERYVAAAAFSDFGQGHDEDALKLAATLDGLLRSPLSPLAAKLEGLPVPDAAALATEHALAILPGLADDLEPHWALWSDELERFQASRDALASGALAVTDLPPARLTVAEWTREPHAAVVDRAAQGDLVLVAVEGERGYRYGAAWRGWAWAPTTSRSRPRIATLSLEKFALTLNSLEGQRAGRWVAEGLGRERTGALAFAAQDGTLLESTLRPDEVAEKLAWFLVERRAATR
ncbi:MAG TPA: DUF6687 family protein [Candidatus Thermoplasmatota archaeon]|jgi:hypothetical protein|nr:DUF6687 family protein [Candidatus Thermoplasmatota archaeon]